MEIPTHTQRPSTAIPGASPEPGPYENYIRGLLPHWPHLRIVTDFMSVDLKDTPTPFAKRMFKTDVRVVDIEYTNPGRSSFFIAVKDQHFDDITQFQKFLGQSRTQGSKVIISRFLMVQDLSAKLIETLGSTFDIDPEFFAQHLGEWWRYYRGFFSDSSENAGYLPYLLKSNTQEQKFQNFTFRRAYEWQEEEWIKETSLANSNLWRPHISQGIRPHVFMSEKFSFLPLGDSGDLAGICLFDPLPHLLAPRLYGAIRNFRAKPPFSMIGGHMQSHREIPPTVSGPKLFQPADSIFPSPLEPGPPGYFYKSLRDETADNIVNISQSSLRNMSPGRDHILIYLTTRVILSSWALVASILSRKMEELEERVSIGAGGDSSSVDIPAYFITLRKYARNFAEDLERTLFTLNNSSSGLDTAIREDTEQLLLEFTRMARRGNIDTPMFHGRRNVEKKQEKFAQVGESVRRLVMLVVVSATLITTILIIWPWMKHWVFVGLSLPILVLAHSISKEFKGLRLHLTWDKIETCGSLNPSNRSSKRKGS